MSKDLKNPTGDVTGGPEAPTEDVASVALTEDVRKSLDDRTDAGQQVALGLLGRVAIVLKLATTHDLHNAALDGPVRDLLGFVNEELAGFEAMRLQSVSHNIFFNHEIVKLKYTAFENAKTLRQLFKRLGISELAFTQRITEQELRGFLGALQGRYWKRGEGGEFSDGMFPGIAVRAIEGDASGVAEEIDERQNLLRSYARLTISVEETLKAVAAGKPPRLSRLRRSFQGLAGASTGHESLLVGLTTFKTFTGDLSFHLTAVSAHVLLMVRRLGLSRAELSECGMAALLHDIGRVELPEAGPDVARDTDLAESLKRVPFLSVLRISGANNSPRALAYSAVAHEHQLPANNSPPPSLLARLIAVPCAFDLMTNPRPPRPPMTPDQTLRLILDQSGTRFDHDVARLFAQTVGLFPVGTTVRLSGGETAVVMEVPSDPSEYAKPIVKVVRTPAGPANYILDLAEAGKGVRIVESVDGAAEQINVPHFLFA